MQRFSIVIPVRASEADLLKEHLGSWLALGSDDVILCSDGKIDPELARGCRTLDSSGAEDGWYYRQGGARRAGFLIAKHDIVLTGDIDLTVTENCIRAVDLVQGDVGMVNLEKERGAPGFQEAVRSLSKRMLRRIRHRLFFTGLYVLNRQAWLDSDDRSTSRALTQSTLKGEDLLLKEAILRTDWRVLYLPMVGGIDHRVALEDRPKGQLEAGGKAWIEHTSPFTVCTRALIYARPFLMGRYLSCANRSHKLLSTLVMIPADGARQAVLRGLRRRNQGVRSAGEKPKRNNAH